MSEENHLHSSNKIPEWLRQLYSDDEKERAANDPIPIKLVRSSGRAYIWSMVKLLDIDKLPGLAGQSCRLFERFLACRINSITSMEEYDTEWLRIKKELKCRLTLYVGVCIELASKMFSMQDRVTLTTLRSKMYKHGLCFSIDEFKEAELEVFQYLGFQVPLWTNVQKAHMLSREVGFSGPLLVAVDLVVDLAEYHRDRVLDRVRAVAGSLSTDSDAGSSRERASTGSIRDLHFIAGAVAATPTILDCTTTAPNTISKLAFLTRSPVSYIECIHNAIFSVLIIARDERSNCLKRFGLELDSD